MNLPSVISFTAAGLLLLVIIPHLGREYGKIQKVLFIILCLLLSAIHFSLGFMITAKGYTQAFIAFRIFLALSLLFPAFALPFFLIFGRKDEGKILSDHVPMIVTLGILVVVAELVLPPYLMIQSLIFQDNTLFSWIVFSGIGKVVAMYLFIANVFALYFFENTYRLATIPGKVTLKYPLLGIIATSIINFAVLSRVLAISVLDSNFIAFFSCGTIILCASFTYATVRYRLFDVQVRISREAATSVLTLVISGLYLLALALISFLSKLLELPYDRLTVSVLGIFAVFLIAAVMISGRARRRLRYFINENFYPDQYNYRKEWRRYAALMASSTIIDDLLSNVISSLCNTMLAKRGFIWVDIHGGKTAVYGIPEDEIDEETVQEIRNELLEESVIIRKNPPFIIKPLRDEQTDRKISCATLDWPRACALIGHKNEGLGIIVLGDKETGAWYTWEDKEFLAMIADQTTLTLENLLMEERLLESMQMESFNRFASFVIHDLKNVVGMLSLLDENAREKLNDTEFQRDAIRTIGRSVEKMKHLTNLLSSHKSPTQIIKIESDIVSLIEEWIPPLKERATSQGITLTVSGVKKLITEIDPHAIERVVTNLVLNAIDATSRGGSITVQIEREGKDWARIAVIDTGEGFDPIYLKERLFQQYHSTKKDGLGIGLVQSKTLVEAHEGKISIESEPDHGATVTVRLPISSNH